MANKGIHNLKAWRMFAVATLSMVAIVALIMVPATENTCAWVVELLLTKVVAASGFKVAWRLARNWGMLPATA